MRPSARFAPLAFALTTLALAIAPASLSAESIFNFETVAVGAALPLAMNSNGLTASFSGSAAVCSSTGFSGPMFTALTGNALAQGLCTTATPGPLTITFSKPLSKLSFAVAINGSTSLPVTVTFRKQGTVVGTQTLTPIVPANTDSPETTLTFTGLFDSVTVASSGLLALDNLDAIPAQ